MTLGEKIRQLRKRKKITQGQLASLIGTHESHIGKYEKDQSVPTSPVLKKIAEAFNVSVDYLLFDKPESESAISSKISDKELLEQFETIDRMDDGKRSIVKKILSMVIHEDQIKMMVSR